MIIDIGFVQSRGPLNLYDADGDPVPFFTWADTKTGEVEQLRTDKQGNFILDPKEKTVQTIRRKYPAPLMIDYVYS